MTGAVAKSDPAASAAPMPTAEEPEASEPEASPLIKSFGEVVTYEDGVSISVSMVGEFTPTPYAAGVTAGKIPTVFLIVVTNNSKQAIKPYTFALANSGGMPAEGISDIGNEEYGELGFDPTGTILPGQTLQWYTAFSLADPLDVTMEISPGFEYEDAIFTNVDF